MKFNELMDLVMAEDCNDLSVGDCFDEEEISDMIWNLTRSEYIGTRNKDNEETWEDVDVDVIIHNLAFDYESKKYQIKKG